MKKNRGSLFVWTGPSGVGKGTILKALLLENKNIYFSISATTRKPRPAEQEGKDYYFLSQTQFKQKIAEDAFLEYATYVGNSYGTLREPVEEALGKGLNVILEVEVQGALNVKKKCPEAIMIFVMAPTFETLKERLIGRGTEDLEKIKKRIETAKKEINHIKAFDYLVINDTVEQAKNELAAIILAQNCKNRMEEIEELL